MRLSGSASLKRQFFAYTFALGVAALTSLPTHAADSCAPPSAGLVSWWPGEGVATDVIDGNSGTLINQATYGPGKVGQAFVLDGNQDGVRVGMATN